MFKIEKGIPYIKQPRPREMKYPWEEMQIGDSFFVPHGRYTSISSNCSYRGRTTEKRFTCTKIGSGVRVWRIK